eukprot:TRINITY_DN9296_c0_g1_i1.p1 TRINITY_DN9296_c0_g1~~TRINITY_DN9296_c0_g1_i1.p1  ORF type:complete len:231 (-),score=49.51 TRINITY_DN9296_c0_g1_i1:143-835(-)
MGQSELKLVPISNREEMQSYLKGETVRTWRFRSELIPEVDSKDNSMEETSSFARFDYNFNSTKDSYDSHIAPMPTLADIQTFCEGVVESCGLAVETLPIALLYLEKLMLNTGNLMNSNNWQKLTLIALLLATKVTSDTEISNKAFAANIPSFPLEEANELERVFMELLEYKLHVNGGEYTKYYFILRAFAEKEKLAWSFRPTSFHKLIELQKASDKLEKECNTQLLYKTR